MHKINTPDGLFHDGDPSSGALGTIVTAAWLNTLQGELVSVLAAAGIKLDEGKNDQLLQAIGKLVSEAAAPVRHGHAWADLSQTPTTLEGYGITDAASSHELAQILLTLLPRADFANQWDSRLSLRMTFQY